MIALGFFMFQGIGSVLPIMEASADRDNFNTLLGISLFILCFTHIVFSELSYYTFGDGLNEPIIIQKLPENWGTVIAKILFCFNILFSYPLTIYVTN
jgi:amino acid permease